MQLAPAYTIVVHMYNYGISILLVVRGKSGALSLSVPAHANRRRTMGPSVFCGRRRQRISWLISSLFSPFHPRSLVSCLFLLLLISCPPRRIFLRQIYPQWHFCLQER